jgi:hypothetical protein
MGAFSGKYKESAKHSLPKRKHPLTVAGNGRLVLEGL